MNIDFDGKMAFDPFFDERIQISGKRPGFPSFKTTVKTCVMPVADDVPFSDQAVKSTRQKYSFMIPDMDDEGGWNRCDNPQIGDEIEYKGKKLTIYIVKPMIGSFYEMEAK